MKKENIIVRRLVNATRYSLAGLAAAWRNEEAFRLEILASIVMIPSSFWIGSNAVEVSLLTGSCFIVLITELLNSAVETIVDKIGTEHHELSGRAKDIGSAAVLVSLVMTILVWGLITAERFF